jgi:hypothetical protein
VRRSDDNRFARSTTSNALTPGMFSQESRSSFSRLRIARSAAKDCPKNGRMAAEKSAEIPWD